MDAGVGRNAMSEEHSVDERAATKDDSTPVNRRRFMKALGVTGGAVALGSMSSTAATATSTKSTDESQVKSDDITGSEENRVVSEAISDSEVNRIKEELTEQGYVPQRNRADAFEVHHLDIDIEYRVVLIPFKTGDSDVQSYILWTDSPRITTVGTKAEQLGEGTSESYEITNYEVGINQLHTTVRTITAEEVRKFKQRYIQNSDGDFSTAGFPNCNINFSCVGKAAGKAGVLFGACASCASGFVPACFACVGSGILLVETNCNLCK